MVQFVFPSSVLNPVKVDEAFEPYANAILDHNASFVLWDGSRIRKHLNEDAVMYRGWIMPESEYQSMEDFLVSRNVPMLTGAHQYANGQFLNKWYNAVKEFTPKTYFFDANVSKDVLISGDALPKDKAFVLKDMSKSFKHYWDTACYSASRDDVYDTMQEFKRLADGVVNGCFAVREFEEWISSCETRLWWYHGELVCMSPHPDTPDQMGDFSIEEFSSIAKALGDLDVAFVTTDVVRHKDGRVRIVEVGDGQVSDPGSVETWNKILDKIIV